MIKTTRVYFSLLINFFALSHIGMSMEHSHFWDASCSQVFI